MNDNLASAPWGKLRGSRTSTGLAFLGVRYGEPPVGERRWKAPVAAQRPEGIYDCGRFGPSPPQIASMATRWRPASAPREMSEDCLNLNVWTPAADRARRPTLVHVFGGGFESGSASEGLQNAEKLSAEGDVVVVRVNFRIGALGFLHLADSFGAEFEGANRGTLDLILALKWVHENIAALGGDPDNVTLFGLSSGAFTIASLFGMPASEGLFAKAWMQSGSASRVLSRAQGAAVAAEFLRAAQIEPGDTAALKGLDLAAILAAQRKAAAIDLGDRNAPGGATLGIVEDGTSLPEHPQKVFARGDRRRTPIVLGFTRDESRLWFASGAMRLPGSFDDVQSEMIRFAGDEGHRLFAFYRKRLPDASPVALREVFLSDAVYAAPAMRTVQAHAAAGGHAYLYRFDWAPPGELAALGAAHGFDEAFVWNVAGTAAFPPSAADPSAAGLGRAMSSSLVAFAREGTPGWAPVSEHLNARIFGGDRSAFEAHESELLNGWRGIERR